MKRTPGFVVLGFYSADEEDPAQAYAALRKERRGSVCWFRANGAANTPATQCERYAPLRLEGEHLVVAYTTRLGAESVVRRLQNSGDPAVFVLPERVRPPVDWGPAGRVNTSSLGDVARQCAALRGRSLEPQEPLLSRLREHESTLDAARSDLAEAARLGHALAAAAEWLLDNAYLIRTQIAEIGRHLPRDYKKILRAGPSGYPCVYELARQLIAHTDYTVNEDNIRDCLREYQAVTPLTIAELWCFPLVLRMALIEALAHLALRVNRSQQLRETAYLWANRLAAAARKDPEVFGQMLGLMEMDPAALEPYFVICLAEQLRDEEDALAQVQHWLEDRLKKSLSELVRGEHTKEAVESVSTANAFGSLRTLARIDYPQIFESTSLVEAELRRDPGDVYAYSDFSTRDHCRRVVERIAGWSGLAELDVARRAVALAREATDPRARHAAYYLLDEGVTRLEAETKARIPIRARPIRSLQRRATPIYIGGISCLTACFAALSLSIAWDAGVHQPSTLAVLGALALFPLSELAIQIVNALVISMLPPDALPKMDFRDGIPDEHATLVAVPILLSSLEVVRREVEKLEVRYLANREPNVFFSLFSDFTDAADETASDDEELLQEARKGIASLNARYQGGPFLLFHRGRSWSESEQCWIGRERKRGKIEELNAFLCGDGDRELLNMGSLPLPIRYVITLDADTQLPPTAARRLVETISHPLNRVEIDLTTRARRRGFTIIQPRVSIGLPGAIASRFTRIFADTNGTDPYCLTVSDAQQDLFGHAIFHGKAIYDVRAFHQILKDRFPSETLLSHDLIEGSYVGVGLATDIELFESMPLDYITFSQRLHRWIRGDWQIAAWMFRQVPVAGGAVEPSPLPAIGRWRIFDNLRRSLVPVASLLLLVLGWLISAAPGVWSVVVGVAIAIPAIAPLLDRWARLLQGTAQGWKGAADDLIRALVMVAFLPHQAYLSMDAIVRARYRGLVSHRNLLEWRTAESAEFHSHHHLRSTLRQMWIICGLSLLLMIVSLVRHEVEPTSVFLALWALSPALMRWLDHPIPRERRRLTPPDMLFLRRLARQTWRYFDDLVNQDTNWLPPDNTQLALRVEVAQRTSPTNIGLWLTSALAARDFGYLTNDELLRRSSLTFATLERLERYEGHLLNWYDTRTLDPLPPRYVSTVDSGNLLASLWLFEQGCSDALRAPVIGHVCFRGLSDTLAILREVCGRDPAVEVPLHALRRLLHGYVDGHALIGRLRLALNPLRQLQDLARWDDGRTDRAYWASRLSQEMNSWTETIGRYLQWMETLIQPPDSFLRSLGDETVKLRRRALHTVPSLLTLADDATTLVDEILMLRETANVRPEVAVWLEQLAAEYALARNNARQTVKSFQALAASAAQFADGVKMSFLYDKQRHLFGVGYLVGGPREFSSHYDLLASECRLASLVAIAKGDVPIDHWFALSRPVASSQSGLVLLSWSGTMFEYLMPLLFTRTFTNSLLDHACREGVQQQIDYGREGKVPWGISECAYSALDSNQIYQYRAFGVPRLALKRELEEDLVVAPYATVLALMVDPVAGLANLKRLEDLGLGGPMGLYESIDYTRQNKRGGKRGVVIYAYMAHHQGMSMMALGNVLHGSILQRRFHNDLRVRAIESLLFERIPAARQPLEETPTSLPPVRVARVEEPAERTWKEDTSVPRVHLHGNGHYSLMVTNSGGGYSRWNQFDVTRWRSDTTLDCWGSYLYLRDLRSDEVWSATQQPLMPPSASSSARFSADRAEFRSRLSGIETVLEVIVAAEDDAELRRLTVTNRSMRTRHIEFTSYLELALAPHGADRSHPVFSKLFVETEYADDGILLAHRRPRSPDEAPIWACHVLVGAPGGIQHETDRAQFLGRGNTAKTAAALKSDLTGSVGAVIDPIFSLRCRAVIEPRDRLEITFITLAGSSREELLTLAGRYRRPESVSRAFEMAWTRAQLEFRYLGVGPSAAHRFQDLASHMLYPNPRLRPPGERLARNRLGQPSLWGYGISGDRPILTVTVTESRSLSLVREVILAHAYWRLRGFRADLVILNQESSNYDRPLRQQLLRQIDAHSAGASIDRPGGIFLRDWDALPEEHRTLILATSTVVLSGSRGPLQQQLAGVREIAAPPPFVPTGRGHEEPSQSLPFLELPYFNGLGGFSADGREYATYLKPGGQTPAPWVNVMANAKFGAMVSESGLGFTWCGNSQAERLTPWQNDPLSDPQSEAIYLRDEDSGAIWTPTALPIREKDAYRARHGQGYTVFEHNSHAIGQELTVFVPTGAEGKGDSVKVYRLRLRNDSSGVRRLSVTYFAEWVLGTFREDQQLHVRTVRDEKSGAVLAHQSWTQNEPDQLAFAAASPRATSYSGDRTQILGRNGAVSKPAALERARLDNRCGAGLDPAVALQVTVTIGPGTQTEVIFLLGQSETVEAVRDLVSRYQSGDQVERALAETKEYWNSTLGALQVHTPLLSTDFLLNRWLLYQTLSCRFWGRSALYQSSGAFGYRDQLQDSLAFLYSAPALTRAHILTSAARQFLEGDVQHWWRPETGLGVRTICSDDLLWLPYAVARYCEVTGDVTILDEQVPFIEGAPLADGEHERMFVPTISPQRAPLWDHCRRAIERASRFGSRGLPLFGGGDWNDGMNRVGIEGRGESVWLGWFMITVLQSFAPLMENREGGAALAEKWHGLAEKLASAVELSCWDGDWYLRGFFDNGSPIGSHLNQEAQIDALPQSWAVISGAAQPERARRAMDSADRYLVDEPDRLVKLLTPPFDHSEPNPGYIMGYPPGLRENGGQYTHGALWVAMARARMGDGQGAVRLLTMMNPVELNRTPEDVEHYRGEPYVVAADISTARGKVGQCGWTWYTGSAGWMYRIWIEEVLGFHLRKDKLAIQPVIPDDWPGFRIAYRYRSTLYDIEVLRDASRSPALELDGAPVSDGLISLVDDGINHHVTVRLSRTIARPRGGDPPAVVGEKTVPILSVKE